MRRALAVVVVLLLVFATYRWVVPAALGWPEVTCESVAPEELDGGVSNPGAEACDRAWRGLVETNPDPFSLLLPVTAARVGFRDNGSVEVVEVSLLFLGLWHVAIND